MLASPAGQERRARREARAVLASTVPLGSTAIRVTQVCLAYQVLADSRVLRARLATTAPRAMLVCQAWTVSLARLA